MLYGNSLGGDWEYGIFLLGGRMNNDELASKIVDGIIADFTDRRGLRQECEEIDKETQEEIRVKWEQIVKDVLGGAE
jgi:uncharacterized lipoprotein YehR (DUF1307 family)